jgi:hypothetical protein
MKKLPLFIGIILICLLSCKDNEQIDPSSVKRMWYDSDSLLMELKGKRVYYLDQSTIQKGLRNPLDTDFVNDNLSVLNAELIESEQLYTYKFYVLDTIKRVFRRFVIVVLEQYEVKLGPYMKSDALKLIHVRNGEVLSAFTLAANRTGILTQTTASSVLLPDNRIISRIVDRICSDAITSDNGELNCWYTQTTSFYEYDYFSDKYSMYQKSINITEHKGKK